MALQPELDETGRPTPVTTFLAVHHGLRRDARRYAPAVAAGADMSRHWATYRAILTFHHQQEDELMFPLLLAKEPALGPIIAQLDADHAALDTLLADLDAAFESGSSEPLLSLVARLADTLDHHLDLEEQHLVPVMSRTDGAGPRKPGDSAFGGLDPAFVLPWLADDLPTDVLDALLSGLPEDLQSSFPQWRQSYAAHWPESASTLR